IALEARMARGRGRIGHRARGLVLLRRQDAREGAVHPLHDAALRAEGGGEAQRLELDRAEAAAPRAQEETDFRLAEAVDRLHRVADEEERAPVARLPARGEPLEELPLRHRGVL